MRLLPKDNEQGWTPYGWLVYLLMFLVYPLLARASALTWVWTIAAICAFLPLYFWGHWLNGRRVLIPAVAMIAIGIAFAPFNPGSTVFFIYAAGFLGQVGEPGVGVKYLAALLAIIGIISWLLNLPPYFWIPALIFSALIGGVDIHFAQRRRMNSKLRMAQEEIEQLAKVAERERIARDLHDLLGHTLSVIIIKSELASKLADRDLNRAITEIRDVERISREALTQVRQAVKGYRSLGFETEFRNAQETLKSAGVQVNAEIESVNLTPPQETVLVLALREAVTNVVRHADATACDLRLKRSPAGCEFEIADNGCGGSAPEGSGLSGMRYRVEALNGTLERDSANGTRLTIRLPLDNVRAIGAA